MRIFLIAGLILYFGGLAFIAGKRIEVYDYPPSFYIGAGVAGIGVFLGAWGIILGDKIVAAVSKFFKGS